MVNEADLTMDEINALADQLGIDIPVKYNVPEDFSVKTVSFTTKAQSVTHRYSGEMPNPHFGSWGKKKKTIPVDYAWVETTEPKTDAWTIPEDAKIKVTENAKSVGKGGFKKTLTNTGSTSKPQKEEKN